MLPTLRFGKYAISGLLGPGGLTETYLAHLPEDADRLFALKLLRPDRLPPDKLAMARERFLNAGKRLQGLLRPGIGRLLDYSRDEIATFLVTEYVPGGDLGYLLGLAKSDASADRPGMDPLFAGLLGAELARVLHLAHQSKPSLPHLGLSLGNVVVGREGDRERRRIKLGIKQLQPTTADEYMAEHQVGESVTGRIVEATKGRAKVELGEGVFAECHVREETANGASVPEPAAKTDIASLTAMLSAKWKQGPAASSPQETPARAGQIRTFRILKLDQPNKKIEVELAG